MSREVDERVVSMQFDNKQFEANVATTMSTLDKLENKLNFKGAGKALDELNASANKVDLSHMGNAVESLEVKFSAMSVAAIAAINRIVNKAFDAGEKLVKSLSIDQITAGWEKYGEKTTAVQTIMAATGDSIDEVNKQLEKMNWFTDETSFNFTDMTNNVGKFTSAGVGLEKAVLAMQGIAAEAALSGQNAQSASRAMYNFSQALGTGAVKVQDWMSIENANMATKEFKETIIETAKELGRVSDAGEILAITSAKYSGDEFVNFSNFRNTLAAGWFDSDVLIKSLEKYGAFATKLQEITDATGTTATEMLRYVREYESGTTDIGKIARITGVSVEELSGYMETLTAKEYELGRKAFQAAQEAKTFREAIDATKDAVSTGWMNTFELLFGNYEEAKILWTKLSEDLWEIFASGGENRNELLSDWKEMFDGRTMLIEGLSTAMDRLIEIIGLVRDAFSNVFPPMTAQRLADITKNFRDLVLSIKIFEDDEETLTGTGKTIYTVFHSLAEVVSVLATALGTLGGIAKGILGAFGDAVKEVFKPLSDDLLTTATTKLKKFIKSLKPGENAFKNLSKIFKIMLTPVKGLLDVFGSLGDRLLSIIPSAEKVGTVFERIFGSERYAKITDGFGKIIDRISGLLQKLFDKISNLFKKNEFGEDSPLSKFLSNVYKILEPIASWILDKIVEGVEALAALDWTSILGSIEENLGKIHTKIGNIIESVQKFFGFSKKGLDKNILGIGSIGDAITNLELSFKSFKYDNSLTGALSNLKNDALSGLGESFTNVGNKIGSFVSKIDPAKVAVVGFGTAMTAALGAATSMMTSAKGVFVGFSGILGQIKTNIAAAKPKQYERISFALIAMAGALIALSFVKPEGLKQATLSMIEMMGAFAALITVLGILEKFLFSDVMSVEKLNGIAIAMIELSAAFLILSVGLMELSKVDTTGMGDKFLYLTGAMVVMTGMATILGLYVPKMTKDLIGILALAGSLYLVVLALKKLDGVDLTGLQGNMLRLMGIMTLISVIAKIGGKGSFSGAMGMIATVGSILILVAVLKRLAEVDFKALEAGIKPMIGLMALLSLVAIATSKASKSAAKAGVAALAIAAATLILVETIRQLSELPTDQAIKGTLGVVSLLAVLAIVVRQLRAVSPNAAKAGVAVVLLSVAVMLLSKTIKMLGGLSWKEALIGVGAVTIILGMFTLIIRSTKDANKAAGTIVAITASIAAIAAAIALLATFDDPNAVLKIAAGMSAIMLAFAGMTKWMGDLKLGTSLKMILLLAGFVAAFKVVMAVLGDTDVEGKEKTVLALGAVLLTLTACVWALGKVKPQDVKAITGNLGEMALLVAGGIAVIAALSLLPESEGIVEKATGFALAVVALSGATLILSNVNPAAIEGVLVGIASLALVVGAVGGIIYALGALLKDGNTLEVMEKGSAAFSLIGEALGSFVGNIIGGLVGGIVSGFNVSVMDGMTKVANKLKEFMDTVGGISSASIENFKGVMEAILLLTAAKFLNGIGLLNNSVKEWKDLGKGLTAFKEAFVSFIVDISALDISATKITSATKAMEGIAELANAIPGGLSIKTAWSGVKDLGDFGKQLTEFAPYFASYINTINGLKIDQNAQNATIAAATAVAEFAKITPKENGLLQALMGTNLDMGAFGEQLSSFADGFVQYADKIKGIDISHVEQFTGPIKAIVEMSNLLGNQGGLWDKIFGADVNMDDFGYNLAMFGLWFKIYAGHLAELPKDLDIVATTQTIASACTALIEMAQKLDKEGGLMGDVYGDNSTALKNFGENLTSYGESIVAFYKTVSEVKPDFKDTIQEFRDAGSKMITSLINGLAAQLEAAKEKALEIMTAVNAIFTDPKIIEDLRDTGSKMVTSFGEGIKTATDSVKTEATNFTNGVISSMTTTLGIVGTGDSAYSTKTKTLGKQAVEGMKLGIGESETSLLNRIKTMGTKVVTTLKDKLGIKSPSRVMRDEVGVFIPQGVAEGIEKDNSAEMAARNKAAQIVDAVSKAFAAIENDEGFSPTITPVLDLSEIQNGAKSINGIIDTNAQLSFGASANLRAISSGFNAIQTQPVTPPQSITNNYGQAITAEQLATAVKEALNGAGVFMDGNRVGNLVTIQQRRASMAMGN